MIKDNYRPAMRLLNRLLDQPSLINLPQVKVALYKYFPARLAAKIEYRLRTR